MAVLLPALSRARKQAKAIVCQANLRQWSTAYCVYLTEYEGKIFEDSVSAKTDNVFTYLQCYLADCNERPTCPAAPRESEDADMVSQVNGSDLCFSPIGGYGHNWYLLGKTYDRLTGWSRFPVFFDCGLNSVFPRHTDPPPEYDGDFWLTRGVYETMKMVCVNRHSGRINMLFLDWSVRPVGLKEIWTLPWGSSFDTAGPWTKAGGVQPEDWPQWMRSFRDY